MVRFEDITQVKITTSETEINELLSKGYRIIKILSSRSVVGDKEVMMPIFTLGLSKEEKK
jgi:hypothetical protein